MKQYFDKTSCRNICMYICYAYTKIQLNPISNFSNICKTNFEYPRDSKTHPRVSGMGKNPLFVENFRGGEKSISGGEKPLEMAATNHSLPIKVGQKDATLKT